MLSKKDLIAINQEFHTGKIANENRLVFAIDHAKRSKDWLKATAYLARAIILDHIFEDGNERTAAAVIATCIEMQNLNFDKNKLDNLVLKIAKKNIQSIETIMRLIKDAFF